MPGTIRSRRLVLKGMPVRESAVVYADSRGWELVSYREADPLEGVAEELMWRAADGIYFYYTVENASGAGCIGLIGKGVELPEGVQEALEADFDVWTVTELLAAVDGSDSPREYAAAVLRAALGAPVEFAQEFFARITDAMRHPDFMVRDIAVSAVAYPAWAQFRPVLREVAGNDSAERVRDNAARILASFNRVGVPEE
ncbi:hypothetical protein ABZX30_12890 [Streptomyces sp. NPDC004542]|uniref:hypothetical protein n=1 Tax=Streptomyces sp. NPDC004542 TaxID=3154281 RepID=UPI0033B850AD